MTLWVNCYSTNQCGVDASALRCSPGVPVFTMCLHPDARQVGTVLAFEVRDAVDLWAELEFYEPVPRFVRAYSLVAFEPGGTRVVAVVVTNLTQAEIHGLNEQHAASMPNKGRA